MKKIILLLFVALSFSSCEKDDICAEETTPRLVLEFYDISNPSNLKKVVGLKVTGVGQTSPLGTYNDSKIKLPLRADADVTQYSLILNSASTTSTSNEDILEFNYTRQNVFVSRACGFKTVFTLNDTNGVVQTDGAAADNLWMQNITTQTTSITTENEVHIKIYF